MNTSSSAASTASPTTMYAERFGPVPIQVARVVSVNGLADPFEEALLMAVRENQPIEDWDGLLRRLHAQASGSTPFLHPG